MPSSSRAARIGPALLSKSLPSGAHFPEGVLLFRLLLVSLSLSLAFHAIYDFLARLAVASMNLAIIPCLLCQHRIYRIHKND